jgi:hypothetical protein
MIRRGVLQSWSLTRVLLAMLGGLAGLVEGTQLAWAHGTPPAVLGGLQTPTGQLAAVKLSRGLAVQQAGQWRFVCPSRWAGQPQPDVVVSAEDQTLWLVRTLPDWRPPGPAELPAPTQVVPASVQVLAPDGHWLQSLPLPTGFVRASLVAALPRPLLLTVQGGPSTWLWSVAGTGWQVWGQAPLAAQSAVYLQASTGQVGEGAVWLAEALTATAATGPALVSLRLAQIGTGSSVVHDLPIGVAGPATVRLTLSAGRLWATVRTATTDHVGLVDVTGPNPTWQPLFADAPPLSEPVVYADQLWLTRAGVIGSVAVLDKGQWQAQPFAVGDNRRWYTCLQPGPLGQVSSNLVCARTQLFPFAPPDAPPAAGQAPLFEILALQPPDYDGLSGSLLYGCWLEWLDLATDSGLTPGQDPTQPVMTTKRNDSDSAACQAGRVGPPLAWPKALSLTGLVGLLVWRRFRAQGRGSVGRRRGAAT